jgi:hypothetical protein
MIGAMGVAETGYPLISVYEDFTPDKNLKRYGSSIDWSFGSLGIPTFSTELWDVFKAAGIQRDDYYPLRNFPECDWLKLLHWQDEALGGDGFMPWTPFDHPQLGPVEIGGWRRMFTFRNPPPARYLEEMARVNCRFTLRHAACAPQLRLRDLAVTPVGGDLWQVSAVVDNMGFLPTNLSAQAVAMHEAKPVVAELTGPPGMTFVQGAARTDLGHLAGRGQRHTAYSRFYDWPASARAVKWIVRLPAGEAVELMLRAGCLRAGMVAATVRIDGQGVVHIELPNATSG